MALHYHNPIIVQADSFGLPVVVRPEITRVRLETISRAYNLGASVLLTKHGQIGSRLRPKWPSGVMTVVAPLLAMEWIGTAKLSNYIISCGLRISGRSGLRYMAVTHPYDVVNVPKQAITL